MSRFTLWLLAIGVTVAIFATGVHSQDDDDSGDGSDPDTDDDGTEDDGNSKRKKNWVEKTKKKRII